MAHTKEEIEYLFQRVYGDSTNFMTPNILEYGEININNKNLIYEISKGKRLIADGQLYGITFIEIDLDENCIKKYDLSTAFYTMEELNDYIKEIEEKIEDGQVI